MFVPGLWKRGAPLPRRRVRAGEPRRRGCRPRAARDRRLRAAGRPGVGDGARDPARGCARTRARTSTSATGSATHDDASSALEQSRAAVQRLEALEAEVTSLSEREDALVDRAGQLPRRPRDPDPAARGVRGQVLGAGAPSCASCSADHPGTTSVAALVELHSATVRVLDAAREALTAREHAARELSQATAAAEAAATTAGFTSLTGRARGRARRRRGGCPVDRARAAPGCPCRRCHRARGDRRGRGPGRGGPGPGRAHRCGARGRGGRATAPTRHTSRRRSGRPGSRSSAAS